MICKDDVLQWFKDLESYNRIDTMCSLLLVCLPFELRFLGTCLEELGRRDSQELRGMELRANNPQDLAADMLTCQKGEPTDIKIRRKMALYLALIRACNRTCVAEIFRTLECWGERDFANLDDQDTLLELMLVYTMAANHPVFSFREQMVCCEILRKIKSNRLIEDLPEEPTLSLLNVSTSTVVLSPPQHSQQQQLLTQQHSMDQQIQHMQPPAPPSHSELIQQQQQHGLHPLHQAGQQQQHPQILTGPLQMMPQGSIPMIFPQHMHKILPNDSNMQSHQINVEGIPTHLLSSNITIPADTTTMIGHPNTWPVRPYPPQSSSVANSTTPGIEQQQQQMPSQSSPSPMLSQQSSPSSSRPTSPNRSSINSGILQQHQQQQQQNAQQIRGLPQRMTGSLKNTRRPSAETTPPPLGIGSQQQQQQQQQHHDMIMPQMVKAQMEDGSDVGSGNQLQNLIRNGYTRSGQHHRIKTANYIPPHQQQQQQPSPINQQPPMQQHFQTGNYVTPNLVYTMQNMNMSNDISSSSGMHSLESSVVSGSLMSINSNKSATTGSESGSSNGSSGEITPPETPTLMTNHISGASVNSGAVAGSGVGLGGYHQKHHLSYNKQQIGLQQRLNGRVDKSFQTSQPQPPAYSNSGDMSTLVQQQQQQQNNSLVNVASTSNQQNNNMPTNTVLISSNSSAGGSPSVLMQPQPTAYNPTYPYHTAPHLAPTTRPPAPTMLTHNAPGLTQPVHGGFRFPLPPNGEILYPAYHPGLTFMSAAPGAPQVPPPTATAPPQLQQVLRNTSNATTPPTQQQPPQLQQQMQNSSVTYNTHNVLPPAHVSSSIISSSNNSRGSSSIGSSSTCNTSVHIGPKNVSCYNCGSQSHTGNECIESSMEDVTRNVYKLDYTVASSASTATDNNKLDNTNVGGGNTGNVSMTTLAAASAAAAASSNINLPQSVSVSSGGSK